MIKRILLSNYRPVSLLSRVWSGSSGEPAKYTEEYLTNILKTNFPKAKTISVLDTSGGCGAMYDIAVESTDFRGISRVKQHRLITEILKKEIKDMHGIRINTSVPSDN